MSKNKPQTKLSVTCWKCGKNIDIMVTSDAIIVGANDELFEVHEYGKLRKVLPETVKNLKPKDSTTFQVLCKNKECPSVPSPSTVVNMVDLLRGEVVLSKYQTPAKEKQYRVEEPSRETIPGRKATPEDTIPGRQATPSEEDWIKEGYARRASSFTSMSDTAKTLITLLTALSGVYLALLAGVSLTGSTGSGAKHLYFQDIVPYFPWGVALLLSIGSLVPLTTSVRSDSPSQVLKANNRALKVKYWLLVFSVLALVAGLGLAAWRIFNLVQRA